MKKESLKPVERSDARRVVSKTDSRPDSRVERPPRPEVNGDRYELRGKRSLWWPSMLTKTTEVNIPHRHGRSPNPRAENVSRILNRACPHKSDPGASRSAPRSSTANMAGSQNRNHHGVATEGFLREHKESETQRMIHCVRPRMAWRLRRRTGTEKILRLRDQQYKLMGRESGQIAADPLLEKEKG